MLNIIMLLVMLSPNSYKFRLTEKVKYKILTISSKIDQYRINRETDKINRLIKHVDTKNIPYYTIEGKVYDQSHNPIIAGYYVYIFNAYTGDLVNYIYPDINGEYMDTLPMGAYIIQAKGDMYPTMYYNSLGGTGRIDSADIVWLTSDTDSINIITPPGNVIKGRLYNDSTASPISNAYGSVTLIDTVLKTAIWKPLSTDSAGNYIIEGVNQGVFKIRYYLSNYRQTYYGDTYNWFYAQVVTLTGWSDTITGMDVNLPPTSSGPQSGTGVITGMLLSDTGDTIKDPYPYATIMDANTGAYLFSTFEYDTTTGVYTFSDLPTGTYKILIDPDNYMPQYYNDKTDFASADPVSVTSPDTTFNIDFNFHRGGAIAGTITGLDGYGYGGAFYLDVYDCNTGDLVYSMFGSTLYDGKFSTGTDLPTGAYKAFLYPTDIGTGQWYKDATNYDNADTIDVTAPDTTYGINFDFYGWTGIISGVIQDDSGNPRAGSVDLYYAYTNEYVTSAYADTGIFCIHNLPAGDYKLYIQPEGGDSLYFFYMPEWYNHQSSWDNATVITLQQDDSIFLTVTLSKGGKVAGSIKDSITGNNISTNAYPFAILLEDGSTGKLEDMDITDFGTYSSYNLTPGDYRMMLLTVSYYDTTSIPPLVYNPYHFEFYENASSHQNASSVTITADTVVIKDFNTTKVGGAIEGSVMNDTLPVTNSYYEVIVVNTEGYPVSVFYTSDTSNYHVGGLLPGNYYLYLWPYGLWYNQVYSPIDVERVPYNIPSNAQMVSVGSSTVTGINFDITGIKEHAKNSFQTIKLPTLLAGNVLMVRGTRNAGEIQIFDISGRELLNEYNTGEKDNMRISVSKLRKGVYFIIVKDKNGNKLAERKMIKIR